MTVIAIVATASAVLLAASRFLETSKPLWKMLPPALRVWVPVLALVLPQLTEKLADAKTPVDLGNLALLALALTLPGAAARDQNHNGIPDEEES